MRQPAGKRAHTRTFAHPSPSPMTLKWQPFRRPKGISPDLQSVLHSPRGNRCRIRQINRASSSVLAGPRAQIRLISAIQSAAEGEPVLGPSHNRLNGSCLSVLLLGSVAEVKSPVFIALFFVGKMPGIAPEPA